MPVYFLLFAPGNYPRNRDSYLFQWWRFANNESSKSSHIVGKQIGRRGLAW